MAHQGGRPPLYTSPEELQKLVDDYLNNYQRPTLAGLAVNLGMSRQSLYNYNEKDEFFDILKRARDIIEAHYEERMIYEDKPVGTIFALKNMGWKDRTDVTTDDKALPTPILDVPKNKRDKETSES